MNMDRYSIFAIVIVIILILLSSLHIPDDEESIIGFADNIHQNDNGFIFFINDSEGNSIKSFSNEMPDDSLHSFYGKYSKDGNIFFISKINDY